MFSCVLTKNAGWIRLKQGRGFSYTRMPPLYSERNGYKRKIFTAFGYRVFKLDW